MTPEPWQGTAGNQTHADAMNRIYAWQTTIYDFTRRYYLIGRDRLISRLNPPDGSVVLEIGCGTARNLIKIARLYPNVRLVGLDISDVMLVEATKALRKAGLGYRARLVQADAANFDAPRLFHPTPIERIVMSYTLSMIPDWQGAIKQALDVLDEGAELHIVDFGEAKGLPAFCRVLLHRWLKAFSVTPRQNLIPYLEEECDRRGLVLETDSLLGGYAVLCKLTSPQL